jgi:hypothetical protein
MRSEGHESRVDSHKLPPTHLKMASSVHARQLVELYEWCQARVYRVLATAKPSSRLYKGEALNIVFLTGRCGALRKDFALTQRMLDVWETQPTSTSFQVLPLYAHAQRRVPRAVEQINNLAHHRWSKPTFASLIEQKKWGGATKEIVIGWIYAVYQKSLDLWGISDTALDTLNHLTRADDQQLSFRAKDNYATQPCEMFVLLVTHLIFVLSVWGERPLASAPLPAVGEMLTDWYDTLSANTERERLNLELQLEVVCCMLILRMPSAHAKAELLLRRILGMPRTDALGLILLPHNNSKPDMYGSTYRQHCDYHTHHLVAYLITLRQYITQ